MKISHTPLDLARSNKKFIAGAVALALVGGIAPSLVQKTNAWVVENPTENYIYTTVGPYYFTESGLDLDDIHNNDATVSIADTSIADFYYGGNGGEVTLNSVKGGESSKKGAPSYHVLPYDYCDDMYACIQGKKIGETEIIISRDGEEDIHIPLKSVELTPKAHNNSGFGNTIKATGELNGASNDLLVLQDAYSDDSSVDVSTSGRSFTITSRAGESAWNAYAELIWTIGNQTVGGGTYYTISNINAVDKIFGDKTNESLLFDATVSLIDTVYGDNTGKYEGFQNFYNEVMSDGSIANIYLGGESVTKSAKKVAVVPARRGYLTELTASDSELSESDRSALTSKLPKNTQVTNFADIRAYVYDFYTYSGGGGNEQRSVTIPEDDEIEKYLIAEFVKLSKKMTLTFEAPEVPAVKKGYTRKWYATYKLNGEVKKIDVEYDEKTNTLRLTTDVFGDFAFGYVDEFVPLTPNTGSTMPKVIAVATATFVPLVAIAGAAFVIRTKKRAAHQLAKKHNHFE